MAEIRNSVEEAEVYIREGTPGAADIALAAALARNPRDAAAWRLMARLAESIGEGFFAARYDAAAEALDLDRAGAGAALPASDRGGLPPRDPDRFLLIKAWGYGFFSDLDHVLGGLLAAEMTGRTPIIHWGANSLFKLADGTDAFRAYFEPPDARTISDLAGKGYDFWPPKWNDGNLAEERVGKQVGPHARISALQFLNRPERVVVSDYHTGVQHLWRWLRPGHPMHGRPVEDTIRYVMATHLRPRAEIAAQAADFAAQRFKSTPVIGAHVRGGDKFVEDPHHEQRIQGIMKSVDFQLARSPRATIYLMTDSIPIIEAYRKRYGQRLAAAECTRTSTRTGLHYMGTKDRRKLGEEVLRDALVALKCDMFIGMGSSNVAAAIYHWKPWGPGAANILGPLINHTPDVTQYMTIDQLKRHFPPADVDSWVKGWV